MRFFEFNYGAWMKIDTHFYRTILLTNQISDENYRIRTQYRCPARDEVALNFSVLLCSACNERNQRLITQNFQNRCFYIWQPVK